MFRGGVPWFSHNRRTQHFMRIGPKRSPAKPPRLNMTHKKGLFSPVLEYIGPRQRTIVANMSIALYFGLACVGLPWLALWLSDWRKLLWVTSLPMLIVLAAPFTVPESAR